MSIILKIILWSFFIYFAYGSLLFFMQRQIIFPRGLIEVPEQYPNIPGLEQLWVNTSFGKIETWFLSPAKERDSTPVPVIIFAHGNGELIDFWPGTKKF